MAGRPIAAPGAVFIAGERRERRCRHLPAPLGSLPKESLALERLLVDSFDDPGHGALHDGPARAGPQFVQLFEQSLSLSHGVELQVDHHEVRVRKGTMDMVPTDTGTLPVHRVAIEGALPAFKVRDGVLNA